MNQRASRGFFAAAFTTTGLLTAAAAAQLGGGSGGSDGSGGFNDGPDVIVGDLNGISTYSAVGGVQAYAVGTTSCNIGDEILLWISGNNQHPVIGQNMYRLMDGRFEQIGMSWLKHGFAALQGSLCQPCTGNGSFDALGVGCSDPYGPGLNASQSRLGPRFQVNPTTGAYPYPFSSPNGSTGNSIFKRVQVEQSDLALPGAQYFVEGHYITADDAQAGNGLNNASYRGVNISSSNFNASFNGPTVRELPAIHAWLAADPGVDLQAVDIPSDGRFWVGARAYDNGDGTWDYEYAIHNLNSHLAARAVSINTQGLNVTNMGFARPKYHSGEPHTNDPWAMSNSGGTASWEGDEFDVADADVDNALRWGTLYNVRFTADAPPTTGDVTMTLFRNGAEVTFTTVVPTAETTCPADFNDDGNVNVFDILDFLDGWENNGPQADYNDSGTVDVFDILDFLADWENGCP